MPNKAAVIFTIVLGAYLLSSVTTAGSGNISYWSNKSPLKLVLNFSSLEWGGVEVVTLALVLPRYVSLARLDISGNLIGSDGAQRLSEALKTNSTLLELKYAASQPPYGARFCTSVSTR